MIKREIEALSEADLRTKVLIPLFQAMGFRDVFHYHGGSLEHGKDIVMWKPDELGARINYAVVVKASKISGKVTGSSSAGEVHMQIQQALNNSYLNSVTAEKQRSHRCWVVCSKAITKEAVAAIEGSLASQGADRVITFVDGDRLWELVDQYLGPSTVAGKLHDIQELLEGASDHHRITASTASGNVTFALEPKYPGAETVEPVIFKSTFAFPDTPEGKAMLAAFEDHRKTGAPVIIKKPFIQEFAIPDFLRPFLDPLNQGISELVLGPAKSQEPLLADIHISEGETRFSLNGLELHGVQIGEEQIIMENSRQPVPWKIRLQLNFLEKRVKFNFTFEYEGATAKRQLEGLRFQSALAKGGQLRVEHVDSGFDIVLVNMESGIIAAPDPGYLKLAEALAFIQAQTRTVIEVPNQAISQQEVEQIYEVVEKITSGRAVVSGSVTAVLSREGAVLLCEKVQRGEHLPLTWIADATECVLGVEIPMGKVAISCSETTVEPATLLRLKAALRDSADDDFEAVLVPVENGLFTVHYYQWLSEAELVDLPRLDSQMQSEVGEEVKASPPMS